MVLDSARRQRVDAAEVSRRSSRESWGGLTLYFICEDAKAAHRGFKERGIQVGEPFVGNDMDVFYFKDPDDYRLSFESPIKKS